MAPRQLGWLVQQLLERDSYVNRETASTLGIEVSDATLDLLKGKSSV